MNTAQEILRNLNPAEVYEQFYTTITFRHWTPFMLEFAAIRPGEQVLDLACGTGIVARNAAPLVGPQGKIVGLDINPAMLVVAQQKVDPAATHFEWKEGNAESIPYPDHCFDLVLCQAGLMLFKNPRQAAAEMYRVLRPGGRAVVLVWQSLDKNPFNQALCQSLSTRMGVDIAAVASSYSLGSVDELHAVLSEAGFPEVKVFPIQYYTFVDDPECYMELSFKGAAAANPVYASMNEEQRSELAKGVADDIEPMIQKYRLGGRLIYPKSTNIAVAVK